MHPSHSEAKQTEVSESGTQKGLLWGHARRWVARALKSPKLPKHWKIKIPSFRLCWFFVAAHRLSLVTASGGYSYFGRAGFSLRWLLLWGPQVWSKGSGGAVHGLSCQWILGQSTAVRAKGKGKNSEAAGGLPDKEARITWRASTAGTFRCLGKGPDFHSNRAGQSPWGPQQRNDIVLAVLIG